MARQGSPDDIDQHEGVVRICDAAGCQLPGVFKAPKSRRQLREYYWFCLEHVRAYNTQWDYFKGMSRLEIEREAEKVYTWDRPTWAAGSAPFTGRTRVNDSGLFGEDGAGSAQSAEADGPRDTAGLVAGLAVLDLKPPQDFVAIRAQYRQLVKLHHPDANGGSPAAEERLKRINQAFDMLRALYGDDVS